jgi:hypothetical protein
LHAASISILAPEAAQDKGKEAQGQGSCGQLRVYSAAKTPEGLAFSSLARYIGRT